MILGMEDVTLLEPLLGSALVVSGDFDAFLTPEDARSVYFESLVSGNGTSAVAVWSDPTFDFTGLGSATNLTLHVGLSTYNVLSTADGSVTVDAPIAEASGAYSIEGDVVGALAGSTVTASVDFSRSSGVAEVEAGTNIGEYQILTPADGSVVVSGVTVSVTYSTGLVTSAQPTSGQTLAEVAEELVQNATPDAEEFGRPTSSNAFVVWAATQPVPTAALTGPRASRVTAEQVGAGKYFQDDYGRAVPTVWGSRTIRAGIQPIGRDRGAVQDQTGLTVDFKGYTYETLAITDHLTEQPGCLMVVDGARYRVTANQRHRALEKHTKFFLSRELESYDQLVQSTDP